MRWRIVMLAVAVAVLPSKSASAASSIVMESKTVDAGESGVTIGAYVSNDVVVKSLVLPIEFREVTPGAFTANTFSLTVQGRVAASPLINLASTAYYPDPDPVNTCSGPVSQSYSVNGSSTQFFTSPDAAWWAGLDISGGMAPGTDGSPGSGTPSFVYTFDVTGIGGSFEIDTCCANSSHLAYLDEFMIPTAVSFTKGIVTINPPPDNQPPMAVCQDVTVNANGTCEANVTPSQVDDGSFDPDGTQPLLSLEPTEPYPLGVTFVDLIAFDGELADTCQATITVNDNSPPTASCPGDTVIIINPGETDAIVNFSISADDNCPGVTVAADHPSGSSFPLGTTLVTVTATDAALNTDICTFHVTVNEVELPNMVAVESKIVVAGATGVTIGVHVSNDVSLQAAAIPLEFRAVTPGSFIANTMTMTLQGRIASSGLTDIQGINFYPTPLVSNSCSGPVSNSYHEIQTSVDFFSPDAVLWYGTTVMDDCLPAGNDGYPGSGTPSLLLTFDVSSVEGAFEIDTCCIEPNNHLVFIECGTPIQYSPEFIKGLIVITSPTACNELSGDVNCDGIVDVFDVVQTVDEAFRDGSPKEPCCLPSD